MCLGYNVSIAIVSSVVKHVLEVAAGVEAIDVRITKPCWITYMRYAS